MTDLTILYYTANRISDHFARSVRTSLLLATGGRFPIVSVSHQPIDFGTVQIVVGDIQPSIAQVYRNILMGCFAATTAYIACCEDDTLYVPEHFAYRPPLDIFAYNEHRYVISRRLSADGRSREAFYYFRPRTQMAQGICARALMLETLTEKFQCFPTPPTSTTIAKKAGWGEPGRYERNLGLTPRKLLRVKWTATPNITFNHVASLMGRRAVQPGDVILETVEPWGNANTLWQRIHG